MPAFDNKTENYFTLTTSKRISKADFISESVLIKLLIEREKPAFEYLYVHYSGSLYSVILNIIHHPMVSEDVLQEVFIKIWQKIYLYDSAKGTLFTWMLNLCRNTAIDAVLSTGFRNQKNLLSTSKLFLADSGNLFNPENIGLRSIVNSLEKIYKEVIVLSYFMGHTDDEVAKQLHIPLGTMKTRKRKALLQLRSLLQ